MANTYHQIYLQIIFAVKYRRAMIDKTWKGKLFGVVGNLINENNCKTIIVNGVEDHVHCLIGLKPVVSVSELMKAVNAKSSKYVNDHSLAESHFEWQDGMAFFHTTSLHWMQFTNTFRIRRNIKKQTFKNEYIDFLNKFKIGYDERYIFQDLV